MELLAAPPIINLDGENENDVLLLAKSLGYFYIHRSSSFGQIPDPNSLKLLVEDLFNLSLEKKLSFDLDYIRSVSLTESPFKQESLSFTKSSEMVNISKSLLIKMLQNLCQQISGRLSDLLELTNESSSFDTLMFNHYFESNEPLIVNRNEDSCFQLHLFATCYLQRLDSFEHQWKTIDDSSEFNNDYILVTLPNFIYRYSIKQSSNYTINYVCYNTNNQLEKGTYFLSLKQNKLLRYFTFFYLYVMQGIPAGFASTALANYLTGEK
jgi:hypothetical protein